MLIHRQTNKPYQPIFQPVDRLGDMSDFKFYWKNELKNADEVWRLKTSLRNHTLAYISLSFDDLGKFVFTNLIERRQSNHQAPFYYIGQTLMAFACLRSRSAGYNGVVVFESKTSLIPWYEEHIGAIRIANTNRMAIFEIAAEDLIQRYLPWENQ